VVISVLPGHLVVPPAHESPPPAPAAHAQGHVHHHVRTHKRTPHLIAASATVPTVSPSRIPALRLQGSADHKRTTSRRPRRSSSPSPRPITSAPAPSPTPSPSPEASGTADVCFGLAVLNVCVPS
jgi:hypothetical protein